MKELNPDQKYFVEEFYEDYREGLSSRRAFIRRLAFITGSMAATVITMSLLGCSASELPDPTEPVPHPEAAASPAAHPTQIAQITSCEPTAPDGLGPFFVPNAPERSGVGQGHVLSGVVSSSVNCRPIPAAQIEFWLVGPNGQYDDDHRATMYADASGAYRFESNLPQPYSGRPAHIHIRVTARGFQTLVTQYYPPVGQTAGTFDLVLLPADEG